MPLISKTKSLLQTDALAGGILLKDALGSKRKGFFKDEKSRTENSASQEISWNTFPFPQKEKNLFVFLRWHLHAPISDSHVPILNSTDNENVHMSCQGITVWTCLPLSNTLSRQTSCSYSPSDDTAENSSVKGNILQFMSRRMALLTIVFAILDIHAKLCLSICLAV